jgi:hypothetical protein
VWCFLAGLYLLIGAIWLAWLAGWINRVELSEKAAPTVSRLGFEFEGEGVRWEVVAGGSLGGHDLRVRWRTSLLGPTVHTAVGAGPWTAVPEGRELSEWLAGITG